MFAKQVALELTAFLDGPSARSLERELAGRLRPLAQTLLEACYDSAGKAPRLMDGQELEAALTLALPGRLSGRDQAAPMRQVVEAYFEHVRETQFAPHAFELATALERVLPQFENAARERAGSAVASARAEPFVHGASKLGRNDPCSCGSGKKYKKCHGKES